MDEILNGTGPGVPTSSLPLQALSQVERRTRHSRTPDVCVCVCVCVCVHACACCGSFCGWLDLCSRVKGACLLVPNQLLFSHIPSKTPVYLSIPK